MLNKSVKASSMGRVLDALSCILGICCKRTYEGEPAIKLEKWLEKGEASRSFEVEFGVSNGVEFARTVPMFEELLGSKANTTSEKADLAASFVHSLVAALADKACDFAETKGCRYVGLSGGVTYSNPIAVWAEDVVRTRGLDFLSHHRVPNGDGGISVGQNAIAGCLLG